MGDILSNLFVDPMIEAGNMKDDGFGFFQVLFHAAAYGYILFVASGWISEGSELLLLTPMKGLVGSVVLPILGAVPDGAIILFSGASQAQLAVGVGALAGSTIMLLTVPWFLALLAGRVDIVKESGGALKAQYGRPAGKRLSKDRSLMESGATVESSIKQAGLIMLVTSLTYLVVQIPAFMNGCGTTNCGCDPKSSNFASCVSDKASEARPFAVIGLASSAILFLAYLVLQYLGLDDESATARRKHFQVLLSSLRSENVNVAILRGIMLHGSPAGGGESGYGTVATPPKGSNFDYYMEQMFKQYNTDRNSKSKDVIDSQEIGAMLHDLHFPEDLRGELNRAGKSKSGLNSKQLKSIVWEWAHRDGAAEFPAEEQDDDDGDSEEEEVPEDIAAVKDPKAQQRMIWIRSLKLMLTGTVVVLVFSDAMCDILSTLGERIGVNAFYVSFVLAPLASNASELLAAKAYAEKKTQITMTISLSSLLGAACMNNTFCLGIFLFQIYSKKLIWEFSAETISIIAVELIMAFFAIQRVHYAWYAFIIVSLFPLSVVLVWVLENIVGLD